MIDEWRPVRGYNGRYEVSFYGQVRRLNKKGVRMLTSYEKKHRRGSRYLVVKLSGETDSKEVKLSRVVYEAFGGPVPNGCSIVHKDGSFQNNEFGNLTLLTKEELGLKTGHTARQKAVLKGTAALVPIEAYRSAREAAKNNYMSYQTVIDRCNGKVKSLTAPDGCVYMWDEDYQYA